MVTFISKPRNIYRLQRQGKNTDHHAWQASKPHSQANKTQSRKQSRSDERIGNPTIVQLKRQRYILFFETVRQFYTIKMNIYKVKVINVIIHLNFPARVFEIIRNNMFMQEKMFLNIIYNLKTVAAVTHLRFKFQVCGHTITDNVCTLLQSEFFSSNCLVLYRKLL